MRTLDAINHFSTPTKLQSARTILKQEERSLGEVLAAQLSPEEEALALELTSIRARVVSGEPFTERRSTFQAHLCPVSSRREVDLVRHVLLQHNKIRHATHNMMAFRIWQPEMQTTLQVPSLPWPPLQRLVHSGVLCGYNLKP